MRKKQLRVEEFADVCSGGTPSTKRPQYWDGDVAWITPKDLSKHTSRYIRKGERNITKEGLDNSSACLLPQNTVILSSRAPVGYVALAEKQLTTNQGCKNLVCKEEISYPPFVYYLLKNSKKVLEAYATGSTYKELSASRLKNIKFLLPEIAIQEKVASILSTYDDLIENNHRRIQLLEQAARLLYKEWFVHLRFPGHEHVKIKDGVPEGWEKVPLSRLCYDARVSVKPSDVPGDTPYVGIEHIPRRSITLSDWSFASKVKSNKFRFEAGDILFGKIRPYFHKVGFSLTNGITSSDVIVIRPVEHSLYLYCLFFLSSDEFVGLASKTVREGSKMPRADWKFLLRFQFLLPCRSLVQAFTEFTTEIVSQLKTLALQNQQLAKARDLLLPRLMNGEIAV